MGEIRPKECEGRELTKDQLGQHVHPLLAGLSLLLNFAHRGHDFANTMAVLGGGHALRLLLGGDAGGG